MKTLTEMYLQEVLKQPEDKPALTDVMFISAYPGANIVKKSREIKRKSEDSLDEFFELWKARVTKDVNARLDANMSPDLIVATVPYIKRDELVVLLARIDEYAEGETQEQFALKIIEMQMVVRNLMTIASEILQELYTKKMAEQQQTSSRIIQPNGGLVIPR